MTADLHQATAQTLALAGQLSGRPDAPGLEALCLAAVQETAARLRAGVRVDDCAPAFVSACACLALSGLTARDAAAGGGVNGFRIGEVSVQSQSGGGTAGRAEALRAEAERLMAPYVTGRDFAFMGVDG